MIEQLICGRTACGKVGLVKVENFRSGKVIPNIYRCVHCKQRTMSPKAADRPIDEVKATGWQRISDDGVKDVLRASAELRAVTKDLSQLGLRVIADKLELSYAKVREAYQIVSDSPEFDGDQLRDRLALGRKIDPEDCRLLALMLQEKLRLEARQQELSVETLAAKHGISPSYCKNIVSGQARA